MTEANRFYLLLHAWVDLTDPRCVKLKGVAYVRLPTCQRGLIEARRARPESGRNGWRELHPRSRFRNCHIRKQVTTFGGALYSGSGARFWH